MNDPIRLKDDPQVSQTLRADLGRVHGVEPRPYDSVAGLARLHSGIAAATASTAIKGALWPWVTAAGLVSATLIGYVVTRPQAAPRQSVVASIESAVVSRGADPHAPKVTQPPPERPVEPLPAATQAPVQHVSERDPDVLLRLETAHLARARAAIEHAPAEALRLAQQGERRFVGGMFEQERRAIIVLTSLRLRQPAAESAAQSFLQQYPHSPLADRIRGELAHPSESP